MNQWVKITDKKTGQEIKHFSVSCDNYCMRRDFINVGEGSIVEFDREYQDGEPTILFYDIMVKGKVIHKSYKFKKKDLEGLFEKMFCIEKYKYDIETWDISVSREVGPLLIEGVSRIVQIK